MADSLKALLKKHAEDLNEHDWSWEKATHRLLQSFIEIQAQGESPRATLVEVDALTASHGAFTRGVSDFVKDPYGRHCVPGEDALYQNYLAGWNMAKQAHNNAIERVAGVYDRTRITKQLDIRALKITT